MYLLYLQAVMAILVLGKAAAKVFFGPLPEAELEEVKPKLVAAVVVIYLLHKEYK